MAPSPVTGFQLFILDVQYKNNLPCDKASQLAVFKWEELDADEKLRYRERALREMADTVDLNSRCQREKALDQIIHTEHRQITILSIESIIDNISFSDFLTQGFILCHMNYYYIEDGKNFKPAEIALCEFNLKTGLTRTFHRFIHAGGVKLGYRNEINERKKIHGISPDLLDVTFEKNGNRLYTAIHDFIATGEGEKRPIFSMPDPQIVCDPGTNPVHSVFLNLAQISEMRSYVPKVLDLNLLMYLMLRKIDSEYHLDLENNLELTLQKCTNWLENNEFDLSQKIACDYHEKTDMVTPCSLSIVKRWAFSICNQCLGYMNVETTPGLHIPPLVESTGFKHRSVYSRRTNQSDQPPRKSQPSTSNADIYDQHSVRPKHTGNQQAKNVAAVVNGVTPNMRFSIEDHSSGYVTRYDHTSAKPQHMENPQPKNLGAWSKPLVSFDNAYASTLKGPLPPPEANSLCDFPKLQISGPEVCKKCKFQIDTCLCSVVFNPRSPQTENPFADTGFPPLGGGAKQSGWQFGPRK